MHKTQSGALPIGRWTIRLVRTAEPVTKPSQTATQVGSSHSIAKKLRSREPIQSKGERRCERVRINSTALLRDTNLHLRSKCKRSTLQHKHAHKVTLSLTKTNRSEKQNPNIKKFHRNCLRGPFHYSVLLPAFALPTRSRASSLPLLDTCTNMSHRAAVRSSFELFGRCAETQVGRLHLITSLSALNSKQPLLGLHLIPPCPSFLKWRFYQYTHEPDYLCVMSNKRTPAIGVGMQKLSRSGAQ